MHSRLIRDLVLAAAGVGLAVVASACAIEDGSIDGDNGALGESDSSGQADTQQEDGVDGVDQDQPSSAASCSATAPGSCESARVASRR